MRFAIILLLLFISNMQSLAQQPLEKVIIKDPGDSSLLKAKANFDKEGNYCFITDSAFIIKGRSNISFDAIGGIYGPDGNLRYTSNKNETKAWYCLNERGICVFGPVMGTQKNYITHGEHVAITVHYKDSAYYYFDNSLLSVTSTAQTLDDWCNFSENGNYIYCAQEKGLYTLYVNGKQIDTSYSRFYEMKINNAGDYIFAEGRKPKVKLGKYDFMFFIHSKAGITTDPVRTVWDCNLHEDGSFYYSGDDNGPSYIYVNNVLYKDLKNISHITLAGKHHLFTFTEHDQQPKLNVDGKVYYSYFEKILEPSIDTLGHFSFFGIKDYYLYTNTDGKPSEKPITMYNLRPTPLYISPQGKPLYYYKTDDSLYLYQEDKLLFDAIPRTANFTVQGYKEILPDCAFTRDKSHTANSLFYLEYDTKGYFIYNGIFSRPMLPADKNFDAGTGKIVAGDFNDHGFYAVQQIGERTFSVNINNKLYQEIELDEVVDGNCFLGKDSFILYGIKNSEFKQFTWKL